MHGALGGILLAALIIVGVTGAAQYDNEQARARVAQMTADK
ncbi:MAG: hypothetical protein AAF737_06275 [Pseudomonadota bacterium]